MFQKTGPAKAAGTTKKAAPVTKAAVKKAAPRRARDDDDADDDGDGVEVAVTSGWGGAKKMQQEYSDYAERFSMKEETKVIRFLNDEPYANVATHWVKRKGKMSFICLGASKCPVCAVGDKPRVAYCFNIIELTDGDPLQWSWETGVRVSKQIERKAKVTKYAPLSSHFYTVERVGLKQDDTVYTLAVVKRVGDLEEDFSELHVPTDAEIAKFKPYVKADTIKGAPSLKEMREIAAEISGDGDEDEDE